MSRQELADRKNSTGSPIPLAVQVETLTGGKVMTPALGHRLDAIVRADEAYYEAREIEHKAERAKREAADRLREAQVIAVTEALMSDKYKGLDSLPDDNVADLEAAHEQAQALMFATDRARKAIVQDAVDEMADPAYRKKLTAAYEAAANLPEPKQDETYGEIAQREYEAGLVLAAVVPLWLVIEGYGASPAEKKQMKRMAEEHPAKLPTLAEIRRAASEIKKQETPQDKERKAAKAAADEAWREQGRIDARARNPKPERDQAQAEALAATT